jgi:hypothetical protein
MIWYNEEIKVPDQPPDIIIQLVGSYEPVSHPAIQIVLRVTNIPDAVLFSHHPSGLCHEEPSDDQVKARYLCKLAKIYSRLVKTPYNELAKMKPIR